MVEITRQDVEEFLFFEARLLDEWRLEEWLGLFTEDGRYLVPPCDLEPSEAARADPQDTLFLIADDRRRIGARVRRLLSKHAHAENPHSRTRRLITNVGIVGRLGDEVRVQANFLVYRLRYGQVDPYIGHYEYVLVAGDGGLRIRERKAVLDLESLGAAGTISGIL